MPHKMLSFQVQQERLSEFVRVWNDEGTTLLAQRGISVNGVWTAGEERMIAVVSSPNPKAIPEALDVLKPLLGGCESISSEEISDVSPQERRARVVTQPDPTRVGPEPTRFGPVETSPDGLVLWVRYVHGVLHDLHHVEVVEGPQTVCLTVFLGRPSGLSEGPHLIPPVALPAWAMVRLDRPLGARAIVDGAE